MNKAGLKKFEWSGSSEKKSKMNSVQQSVESVCKFVLCVLLTQFGKTFTAIGRIIDEIDRDKDKEFGRSIHLVWTMNTLLNNTQFSNRLKQIERKYGRGSVVVFASTYNGEYKHVKNLDSLQGIVLDETTCPRVVVMCSNDVRFKEGFKFINVLNSNQTCICRVYGYFDELHEYISDKVRNMIEDMDKMDIVKGITALTATPDKILLKTGYWSQIRMIKLDEFNDTNYAGFADMVFNLVDDYFIDPYVRPKPFDFDQLDRNTVGFIRHVLQAYPYILGKGTRTFIPGHIRRLGHQEVRKIVFEVCPDAVVVMLNGFEKNLQYKDSMGCIKTIPIVSQTEEVCQTILRIVETHMLGGRSLVVTGFICVGMGQTLIEPTLGPFTSAILSHLDLTNDEIYQLFGRLTARSKGWANYVATQIFCPTKIMYRIQAMEHLSRNIATVHNGELVTETDYRVPLEIMDAGQAAKENMREKKEKKPRKPKKQPVQHNEAFKTLQEVHAFLFAIYKKPYHPKPKNIAGWMITTRLPSYYKKTQDQLVETDRLTKESFDLIRMGTNISKIAGSGQPYMMYPVYPTMESGQEDLRYYLRYMKPEDLQVKE